MRHSEDSELVGEATPSAAIELRLDANLQLQFCRAERYPRLQEWSLDHPQAPLSELFYEGDRKRLQVALEDLSATTPTVTMVARLRFCDSQPNWFQTHLQAFYDLQTGALVGLAALAFPRSGNLEDERFLRELAAGVEQSADAFVITDLEGVICYVNPAFTTISGYEPQDAIDQPMRILKSGVHSPEFYQDLWRTIRSGGIWRGRITNRRKNGDFYEEYQTISPVRDSRGRIAKFITVKRDISSETRLERELGQRRRVEAVGRLAGGIAHDFNNILTAIMGANFLLQDSLDSGEFDPKEAREQMKQIESSARVAADLTRKLLTFSRQEPTETRAIDLRDVVTETHDILVHLLRGDIDLRLQCPEAPVQVLGDSSQVKQIVLNLAVNAQEAMPKGGLLTITLSECDASEHRGRRALLTVKDDGHGMAPSVKERIFEPFFSTKPLYEGAGLGLSNVHGIVTEMGGKIEVDSAEGEGTEFRIYLPFSFEGN